MDPQLWVDHCTFFGLDPNNHSPIYEVKGIRGFKYTTMGSDGVEQSQGLHTPQTYGAFFMLGNWRYGVVRGGFLADGICVRKTLETLTYIVVCRIINLAWLDVIQDRDANRGKHLPKSTKEQQQSSKSVCPSRREWGIQCPCVENRVTARLH